MWLLLAFIAIPMIEIALFIQVGGWIGLWPTLALVLLSALVGSWLVRSQGARALIQLKSSFNELRDPTEPLANGAMILFAGALLLTPGFFTDAVGILLLIPSVRRALFQWLRGRVVLQGFDSPKSPRHPDVTVIDGEFTDLTPDQRATHQPSGWTKH